jgi:hypothetical protein
MSKYCKEIVMQYKGQVYKFTGIYGHIRPDEWRQNRTDVIFKKHENKLKIGDRVTYEQIEINGRRHAKNLQKT